MPIWNLFSKGKKKKLEAEVLFQVALQREQAAAQHEQAIEVERQYRLEEAALAKQRLQREEEDYRRQQEFAEQNRRYTRAFPAPLRSMENRARARQELRRQQEEHQHRLTAEQEKELLKQMAREHKIIRGEQAEIKARQGQNSPKQFQYESFTHDNRDTKNIVAEAKSKGGYYNIPANLEVLDPVRSEPQLQMRVRAAEKSDFNSLGSNATRAVATAHFSSRSVPEDVKEPNAEEIYPEENSGTENLENSNTSDGEDSSYSGTSSSPTRNNALLVSQVEEKRQALLDRLMEYFYSTFDPSARGFKSYTGPNSLGNSGASGIGNGANKHSSEATGSHRAVDNDSLSHKGDAGDDSNDGPPRGGKLRKNWSGSVKRLACPYFKHNPRRYQDITSCPGPGWSSVPRLKEHLYRRHASPIHCPRCYQHFEHTMELKDHQRASEGCDVRTKTAIEGFDKEQETRLRSKKRSAVSRSEEDKWREVYIILFPDEDESNIPTPCKHPQSCSLGQHIITK
ncbi:hypothetical protein BU16DRAFT_386157 [Lophium mytilinum]|uniref:C2H2-type domain-containing protein n=1 Tax=Lophium mytilinum TaxID=390894 RepID=A0A6A6QSD8_9PEZI|nr:hypothetical protein BU16DRAFT_386157 [Lophium mytilinum]